MLQVGAGGAEGIMGCVLVTTGGVSLARASLLLDVSLRLDPVRPVSELIARGTTGGVKEGAEYDRPVVDEECERWEECER